MRYAVEWCSSLWGRRRALLPELALAVALLGRPLPPGSTAHSAEPGVSPASTLADTDPARFCAEQKARLMQTRRAFGPDPTPNERRYDVRSYDLRFSLDPAALRLEGSATIRAVVVDGPLDTLECDLADSMHVQSVQAPDSGGAYLHHDDLLKIPLDRPYLSGETVQVTVRYAGTPTGGAFVFDHQNGQPMIWTLSEPFGAHTWWPCKDHPEDKADSVDFRVSLPSGLVVASNGSLRAQNDDGVTSTCWWHESYPIATYLVSLAATSYHVYSDWYRPEAVPRPVDTPESMEVRFYNYPADLSRWQPVQEKVTHMIGSYAARYGEYPFIREKYGHAQFNWGGGMEHETIASMGASSEGVVAHELAHQWWGDLVTCRDFHEVWLNEGFATYGEALWAEAKGGAEAYRALLLGYAYFGPGTIYVPDLTSFNRIFNADLSYHKAAWVLHMLRHVVGDESFFGIFRKYREQFGGGAASTADFRGVAEEVSGRPLGRFFDQWIYGELSPIYAYSWETGRGGEGYWLRLRLRQLQSGQIFGMPVDVVAGTASGLRTFVVENASADTTYVLQLEEQPTSVTLDPDHWILRRVLPPAGPIEAERPVLLVNGCLWRNPGLDRLRRSYAARAFMGSYSFDFWDAQDAPADGYPANLPLPLGHGPVPADVLRRYASVVWVARTDPAPWQASPMYSYLENGGNLLLLANQIDGILLEPFADYLGVQFDRRDRVTRARAALDGLVDLRPLDAAVTASTFPLDLAEGTRVLFTTAVDDSTSRGLGAMRQPTWIDSTHTQPGRFVFISGSPEAWNPDDLRANMDSLLGKYLLPKTSSPVALLLTAARPNPMRGGASLDYFLPAPGRARIGIWDVLGRRIRRLRDATSPAGWNTEIWEGRTDSGHPAASGVYFIRLEAGGTSRVSKVTLIH